MNIGARLLSAGLTLLVIGGCVSSTTTSRQAMSETTSEEAAERNFELGILYYRRGNYELARKRLESALEFDPEMAVAHMTLGMTFVKLENSRLATEHYKLAVKYEPDNFQVRNAYAVFLCGQREFDEAEQHFERAVSHPENDDPELMLTNAGVCMSQKPDIVLAENYLRRAIDKKPSYGEALFHMARLKKNSGDDFAARAFVQRFLGTNKSNPEILLLAIDIEESLGDERASTDFVSQLLREFPDSAEARQVLDKGLYSRSSE